MNLLNFSWGKWVFLVKDIGVRLVVFVVIINDVNVVVLSENLYGLGRDLRDFVVLMLGMGFGSGIVVNN